LKEKKRNYVLKNKTIKSLKKIYILNFNNFIIMKSNKRILATLVAVGLVVISILNTTSAYIDDQIK
jgi:hypothetical protein